MLSKTRTTMITLVTALVALVLPTSALAESSLAEWHYNRAVPCSSTTECSPVQPVQGQLYDLNDRYEFARSGPSLVYGYTPCARSGAVPGVPLQWASPGQLQWEFRRRAQHPRTSAITGLEQVALYNHVHRASLVLEGSKFGHAHQPHTVGLVFSRTPNYEWQVADGKGDWAELYNTRAQAYLSGMHWLVEGESSYCGIDLSWQAGPFSLPNGYQPPEERQFREEPRIEREPPKKAPQAGSPEPPKNAPASSPPLTTTYEPPPAK